MSDFSFYSLSTYSSYGPYWYNQSQKCGISKFQKKPLSYNVTPWHYDYTLPCCQSGMNNIVDPKFKNKMKCCQK